MGIEPTTGVYPVRAGGEIRTRDLCFTKALLYQLSYSGSNGTNECVAPPASPCEAWRAGLLHPAGRGKLSHLGESG